VKRNLAIALLALAAGVAQAQTQYTDVTDAATTAFETVAAIVVTIMVFYVGIRQVKKGLGGK